MTGRFMGIALGVGALFAPAAAHAAANHNGALGQIGDKFEWSDNNNRFALGTDYAAPPSQAFPTCSDPGMPCDTTLLHVTAPGELDVEAHDTGLVRPDVDLYVYASDKDGAVGDEIAESATPSADEFASADVDPGYYLVRVAYYSGAQNNSTGKATLNEIPPPDPEDEE